MPSGTLSPSTGKGTGLVTRHLLYSRPSLGIGLCPTSPKATMPIRQVKDTGLPVAVTPAADAGLQFDWFVTKNWTEIITRILQMEK